MKRLNDYVPNTLIKYLTESEGKKDMFTAEQELLTCAVLDWTINQGKEFNASTFMEDNKDVMDKLATYDSKPFIDICTNFLNDSAWAKSFQFQVDTYKNFMKEYSAWSSNAGKTHFVHHDTQLDVCNGKVEKDRSGVVQRVDMHKTYGIKQKDVYQKADIYAINDGVKVDVKTDNPIEEEIAYWSNAATNGDFIGISLKKLGHAVSAPKVYNMKDISENAEVTSVYLDFKPFAKLRFKDENDFKRGDVSAKFTFGVTWDDEKEQYDINIRSAGASCIVGLTKKGASAQQGNCTTLLKQFVSDTMEWHENKNISSDEVNELLDDMRTRFEEIGVPVKDIPDLRKFPEAERAIDWLCTQNDSKTLGKDVQELMRWKKVMVQQIDYLNAVFQLTIKERDKAEKKDMKIDGPESLLLAMWTLLKASKGINQDNDMNHLPYLMIG